MRGQKVLFIGSHPDDIDLGCAISMHDHYLRGDAVSTVVLTRGGRGGASHERLQEQRNSFQLLAPEAHNIFLDYPDTELIFYTHQIINSLIAILQEDPQDIIYIPAGQDFHQDHVVTNECALAALNNLGVGSVYSYETPSTMPSFTPNFFRLCAHDQFRIKLEALKCHVSQLDKHYFCEAVICSLAKMRAVQGKWYHGVAEAYEIVRLTEGVVQKGVLHGHPWYVHQP